MTTRGHHTNGATLLAPATVEGLEHGQKRARRRAARRRRKNTITTWFVISIMAGIVGVAGYYGWQFYQDEQQQHLNDGEIQKRTPHEALDILQNQPQWNGPGNPNFGVGSAEP